MPAFSVIQEVKAVDERTVTITIAQRDLEFISYLTSAIIPKGYDDQATHPVGTRPVHVRVPLPAGELRHPAL